MLEKMFKLKDNNTTVKTEIMAGITTFMTMAYILAVNPSMLEAAGMDKHGVLIATALAAFVGTLCMAFFSNYPFALAPGMGVNAYFAYTVCIQMGYNWRVALLAVFAEGIIFIILSLTRVREAIFNAIPMNLKQAVSVGIGLFVAFIGLQDAKLIIADSSTLLTYQKFHDNFRSVGITAILSLVGVMIIAFLLVKKVKGCILYGILITWVLGIICELLGIYVPKAEAGMYSLIPSFEGGLHLSSFTKVAGQVFAVFKPGANYLDGLGIFDFIVVICSFLFVDLFDTIGTLIGVSSKANMLDEEGKLPKIKQALLADAVATTAGAVFGTSTTTTYVESSSGVAAGGRTGLTGLTTAVLFLLAIVFSPVFIAIPSFAIAPALITVGFYMIGSVVKINFEDASEAIPAFLTIIIMPFAYSIAEGIAIGIISYTLINLCTGKAKKLSWLMYVLTVIFILKYIFL